MESRGSNNAGFAAAAGIPPQKSVSERQSSESTASMFGMKPPQKYGALPFGDYPLNQPVEIPINPAVADSGRVIDDLSKKRSSSEDLVRDNETAALWQTVGSEAAADLAVDRSDAEARHWFSRSLATETGIPDAVVLRLLSYKISRSRNQRQGKPWFYDSAKKLAERFPYLTVAALEKLLQRNAKAGRIERGNFNRQSRDRTTWYTMSPSWLHRAEQDLIGFYVEDAVAYGLPAAVLLMNLQYEIGCALGLDPRGPATCSFSATQAAKYLPISKSTLERSIRQLGAVGVLSRHPGTEPDGNRWELSADLSHRVQPIYKRPKRSSSRVATSSVAVPGIITPGNVVTPVTPPAPPTPARVQVDPGDHRLATLLAKENGEVLAAMSSTDIDKVLDASAKAAQTLLNDLIARKAMRQWIGFGTYYAVLEAINPQIHDASPPIPSLIQSFVREIIFRIFGSSNRRVVPGNILLVRRAYLLSLNAQKALGLELQADVLERFEEHRRECASPDKDKEQLVDITPAEKARVLRNAINAQNNIGILTAQQQIKPRLLTCDRSALEAVELFYAVNRTWNVAILVEIMVRCDDLNRYESDGKYDEVWHARRGKDLRFLLLNLDRVIQGLGMSAAAPRFTPVEKGILFPGSAAADDSSDHAPQAGPMEA